MNYSIIKDKDKFREFIEWLPDTPEGMTFYCALFARKKYCADVKYIKTDKAQCARILSKKSDLFNKVRRLECPLGSYEVKGTVIPQEALALYISVNPRDMKLASKNSLIKLAQLVTQEYNGFNPVAEVMSEVHRARGKKLYYDIDFDNVDFETTRDTIKNFLNEDCLTFIKTKNGFHCLIELKKINPQFNKTWHRNVSVIEGADVCGDNLINVVGCCQSDFVPHFIK